MTPTVLLIVQSLLKYGPDVAREIAVIFSNPSPSLADWEKVFSIADKSYDSYISSTPSNTGINLTSKIG